MSQKRRNHSPALKAKVALDAIKGDQTLSELSARYQVNANLIVKWKKQLKYLPQAKAWHQTVKLRSKTFKRK